MAHVRVHLRRAHGRIALAKTYEEDGALYSAAQCLKEAAEHMELAAEQHSIDLEKLMAESGK